MQPAGAQVSQSVSQVSARRSGWPNESLMLTAGAAHSCAQYDSGPVTVNSRDTLPGETLPASAARLPPPPALFDPPGPVVPVVEMPPHAATTSPKTPRTALARLVDVTMLPDHARNPRATFTSTDFSPVSPFGRSPVCQRVPNTDGTSAISLARVDGIHDGRATRRDEDLSIWYPSVVA